MKTTQRVVSMTGYGNAVCQNPDFSIELDLRSVNSRYLDVIVKCPDELRTLEPMIREHIAKTISRGKVEVRINLRSPSAAKVSPPDAEVIARLLAAQDAVAELSPSARTLSVADILRWPGVVAEPINPQAQATRDAGVHTALAEALAAHSASREREGAALAATILSRAAQARIGVEAAIPAAQRVRAEFGLRLRAKIDATGIAVDPDRLAQEIVLNAQRIDIDEEVDRLRTHLTEVERVLAKGGDVGKRLDFLMQELNREANTLGSKSADAETTRIAIDLKVLIEQMREQVQNLQ